MEMKWHNNNNTWGGTMRLCVSCVSMSSNKIHRVFRWAQIKSISERANENYWKWSQMFVKSCNPQRKMYDNVSAYLCIVCVYLEWLTGRKSFCYLSAKVHFQDVFIWFWHLILLLRGKSVPCPLNVKMFVECYSAYFSNVFKFL